MEQRQLEVWQRQLARKAAALEAAEAAAHSWEQKAATAARTVASVETAQVLVQRVSEVVQDAAHRQIAAVVSRCLEAVFGDESYEFTIAFEKKRGKTEARLVFVRDGQEVDPTGAAGGGVVDVAAFALRLACLVLARPRRRRFLALDEPMRMLSREYVPRVRALLETVCVDMGLQLLIITHNRRLATGTVVELG
jgi:DNA repair exonuclease SbcCD ATPase subunit